MLTLVIFLFFLFLVPYHLYDSAQLIYFLHPFHQADPSFLSRDWYTAQTPNPQPFFGWLMTILKIHTDFPPSLFFIHVLELFLFTVGISKLVKLFSEDFRTRVLVFMLLLFYFAEGLGQSDLYSGIVRATEFGALFYLFSLVEMFQGKLIRMWIFLGLSALFHIQTGMEGFLVLVILWFLQRKQWNLAQMTKGFFLFLLIASPNLIPVFRHFGVDSSRVSPEIFKVLFNFRSPHHYLASTFELSHVFRILFPLIFLMGKKEENTNRIALTRLYVITLLLFCLAAAISTGVLYLPFIGRLFLFRLSPFLLLLGLIFLAKTIIKSDGVLAGLTFVILFLEKDSRLFIFLAPLLALAWTYPKKNRFSDLALGFLTTVAFLARGRGIDLLINLGLASVLITLLRIQTRRPLFQALLGLLFLGFPALTLHLVFPQRSSLHSLEIRPRPILLQNQPALEEALVWIRTHTPKDVLLLTPPYQDGVRFFSERAIVVDFHGLPYGGQAMQEWKTRLERVTRSGKLEGWDPDTDSLKPQREWLRERYLRLRAEEVREIAEEYGADYFLTESSFPGKDGLVARGAKIVFENSAYLVFQLR